MNKKIVLWVIAVALFALAISLLVGNEVSTTQEGTKQDIGSAGEIGIQINENPGVEDKLNKEGTQGNP